MAKFRARALEWLHSKTYLKSEIDTALNGKSDSNHAHSQYLTSHRTVDSSFSNSSTNAVQNKVITPALNEKVDENDLLDLIYPVGAIYIDANTSNSTCPIATLLGGTWTRIQDKFLLASTDNQGVGTTGGSADAVVVEHNHTQNAHNHGAGSGMEFITASSGTNFALYAKHGLPTTSGSYCTMYASSQGTVNEPTTTADTTATNQKSGVDGTGKNMPPYLMVNVWKRIS